MHVVLLVCVAMLAYVYAVYPLMCALIARIRRRRVLSAPNTPRVSILITAYNEVAQIAASVRNKLELDYRPRR